MSYNYSDPTAIEANFPGQEPKPRGWWSRNWKWFVPATLLGLVLMCSGCVAAILFGIVGLLRSSPPYVTTMEKIQADPQVKEAFGEPIRDVSWIPAGELNTQNDTGTAELRWDLAGPKGKGKVYVKARMTNGKWDIVMIEVIPPEGKKIVLHDEGPGGNEAPVFNPQGKTAPEKPQETSPPPELNPTIPMPEEMEPKK